MPLRLSGKLDVVWTAPYVDASDSRGQPPKFINNLPIRSCRYWTLDFRGDIYWRICHSAKNEGMSPKKGPFQKETVPTSIFQGISVYISFRGSSIVSVEPLKSDAKTFVWVPKSYYTPSLQLVINSIDVPNILISFQLPYSRYIRVPRN